jgi:polyisoprenyl-phosphate glycosyltransferase
MPSPFATIGIVTPVHNDWAALTRLLAELAEVAAPRPWTIRVIVVDDASSEPPNLETAPPSLDIAIVRLTSNLGHQRAIAIGLNVAAEDKELDCVVVMDADGEDRPLDLPALIAESEADPGLVVCARRARRVESYRFRAFYAVYKVLFRMLTGHSIDFGNFCVVPRARLAQLCHNPLIWSHLAAALTRSRLPLVRIGVARGQRYCGRSRMDWASLVTHGLSAIAVYADLVLARIALALSALFLVAILGLVAVVAIRLFTDLAIPGWASNVAGSLTILAVQSLVFAVVTAFLLLNNRTLPLIIPAQEYRRYILDRAIWRDPLKPPALRREKTRA